MPPDQMPSHSSLRIRDISKRFGRRIVFQSLSAEVASRQTLVIAGPNGSGKSTLMKILAGIIAPTAGSVHFSEGGSDIERFALRSRLGFVAPDLTLYSELTAAENLQFFGRLRGIDLTRDDLMGLLERVGLRGRGRDLVGAYSSGMRQRLKYAFALLHNPPLLLLDEPTANLDAQGVEVVEEIIADQRSRGITVIATNEPRETEWGDLLLQLGESH